MAILESIDCLQKPPENQANDFRFFILYESITLFHQPVDREHDRDARQRHPQHAGNKTNGCHGKSTKTRNHRLLFPAINPIAAGNRAPKTRRPQGVLINFSERADE
jgi:hypothetical protein